MFCLVTKYILGHISWTGRWAGNGSHPFLSSLRYQTHRFYLIKTLTSDFPEKVKAKGLAPGHRAAARAPISHLHTACLGQEAITPDQSYPCARGLEPVVQDVLLLLGRGCPSEEGRWPSIFIFSDGFFLPDISLILRKALPPPLFLPF